MKFLLSRVRHNCWTIHPNHTRPCARMIIALGLEGANKMRTRNKEARPYKMLQRRGCLSPFWTTLIIPQELQYQLVARGL